MNYEQISQLESTYHSGAVGRRPVALVRAKGARLWDSEGKEYIDCAAAQGWANVGHSHPAVTAAIVGLRSSKQLEGVIGAADFRLRPQEIEELESFLAAGSPSVR